MGLAHPKPYMGGANYGALIMRRLGVPTRRSEYTIKPTSGRADTRMSHVALQCAAKICRNYATIDILLHISNFLYRRNNWRVLLYRAPHLDQEEGLKTRELRALCRLLSPVTNVRCFDNLFFFVITPYYWIEVPYFYIIIFVVNILFSFCSDFHP
jgi:hypothetical protein